MCYDLNIEIFQYMNNKDLLKIFKALADKTRIEIMAQLIKKKEMSCQELSKHFNLSQPTLSHHYNKLIDAQLLSSERNGVLWIYRLNVPYIETLGIDLEKMVENEKYK